MRDVVGTSGARTMNGAQRAGRRGNLALNLPIAWRLTLGFVVAGLIAAAAAGIVGGQRARALGQQSAFYQTLLQNNTNLDDGDSYLQLMDSKTHEIIDVALSAAPSVETLASDEQEVPLLAQNYTNLLTTYAAHDLLAQSANDLDTLRLAGDTTSVTLQTALVSSALRTWRAYQDAQRQVLASVAAGDIAGAQATERLSGEPTNADAHSALRALIQFNNTLSSTVRQAANVQEGNVNAISVIAALLAFLAVALVGWVISETIVRRLRSLRMVTQSVEHGVLDSRVRVVGRDEIGDVSASVNGMLDTIMGLLEESRRQRDALGSAAERLFTDMRVASGGDLRVSASVSTDPIGLLGNAFNLTIGRFKRFIGRSRLAAEQLDGMARQQMERSDAFIVAVRHTTSAPGSSFTFPAASASTWSLSDGGTTSPDGSEALSDLTETQRALRVSTSEQVERLRALVERLASDEVMGLTRHVLEGIEQAYISLVRLTQLMARLPHAAVESVGLGDALTEELRILDTMVQRVGQDAYALTQSQPEMLSALRETLTETTVALSAGALTSPQAGAPSNTPASDPQLFEFVRLSSSYAQEMSALARQVLVVAQEMRVNVTPFQLDSSPDLADGWNQAGAYDPPAITRPFQGRG